MILELILFIVRSLLNVVLLVPRLLLKITVIPKLKLWPGKRTKDASPAQHTQ